MNNWKEMLNEKFGRFDTKQKTWKYNEENCPGHVAWEKDPKICGRCGVHIDSLRDDCCHFPD